MVSALLVLAQLAAAASSPLSVVSTPVAPLKMQLAPIVISGCEQLAPPSLTAPRDANAARILLAEAQESALQGDRAAARATLERAMQRDPLDERIVLELSRLLEEMPPGAVNAPTNAPANAATSRAQAITVTCRGLALSGTTRGREELTARLSRLLSPAQRAARADADARFSSGLAAARRGQWSLAVTAFADAERLLPSAPEAPFNRAVALILAGRRSDAVRAFERYLELVPAAPERLAITRSFAVLRRPVYAKGTVLARGLLPGGGQFATGRPAAGTLVLGAVVGATVAGLLPQTRERTIPYVDPNGLSVPYTEQYTVRPYLGPALAGAAVMTIVAAWEAYAVAQRSAAPVRIAVVPRPGALLAFEISRRSRK